VNYVSHGVSKIATDEEPDSRLTTRIVARNGHLVG